MSPLWMVVIGLWCGAVSVLTGCNSGGAVTGAASADVYLARPRAIVPAKLVLPHVINGLGGGIVVVTGRSDEVAADGIATASRVPLEAGRIEAIRRVTVTNDADRVEVRLLPQEANKKSQEPSFGAQLHVAVPPTADLLDVSAPAGGNIEVYGNVGKVTAVITNSGNIEVRGADGDVNLTTQRGSIIADIMQGRVVTARAVDGNIDIHAVNALVSAATTNKDIRFYGTLQGAQTHYFTTTGAGSIKVAVPAYPNGRDYYRTPQQQIYRFYITTTNATPVNAEYPALRASDGTALPICGFIHSSGPFDYHVEYTTTLTGRIEVSPVVTGTEFFSGTLASNYYRFDTNQTKVAFYTPQPQSIHIYTAEQGNQINARRESIAPECQAALDADSGSAIVLRMKTDRGPVYIHHMLMLQ